MSDQQSDKPDHLTVAALDAAAAYYAREGHSKQAREVTKAARFIEASLVSAELSLEPNTVTISGALYGELLRWFEKFEDSPIIHDQGLPQRLNDAAHQSAQARRSAKSHELDIVPRSMYEELLASHSALLDREMRRESVLHSDLIRKTAGSYFGKEGDIYRCTEAIRELLLELPEAPRSASEPFVPTPTGYYYSCPKCGREVQWEGPDAEINVYGGRIQHSYCGAVVDIIRRTEHRGEQ